MAHPEETHGPPPALKQPRDGDPISAVVPHPSHHSARRSGRAAKDSVRPGLHEPFRASRRGPLHQVDRSDRLGRDRAGIGLPHLPGFERLQFAMDLVEGKKHRMAAAFGLKGMLAWFRQMCPDGEPEPTANDLIRPERIADGLEQALRDRATWWGG